MDVSDVQGILAMRYLECVEVPRELVSSRSLVLEVVFSTDVMWYAPLSCPYVSP